MKILGISQHHNSSVCLIEDGDIKLHLDDERVSGIKRNTECFTALDCINDEVEYVYVSGFSPNADYNHDYQDYLLRKGKNFRYYIAKDTVDEKIVKALRKKINIASAIMGEELKEWI